MGRMNWVQRVLADSGDDTRFRSGMAMILAPLIALVPPLSGRMDALTFLMVATFGSVVVLPLWRQVGEPLNKPGSIIAFLGLLIGPLVVARMSSALAIWTYLGAWGFTLALMRFVTRWRDPMGGAPDR